MSEKNLFLPHRQKALQKLLGKAGPMIRSLVIECAKTPEPGNVKVGKVNIEYEDPDAGPMRMQVVCLNMREVDAKSENVVEAVPSPEPSLPVQEV